MFNAVALIILGVKLNITSVLVLGIISVVFKIIYGIIKLIEENN